MHMHVRLRSRFAYKCSVENHAMCMHTYIHVRPQVSAVTACNYLQTVLPFIDVPLTSCLLLVAFAVVVILGCVHILSNGICPCPMPTINHTKPNRVPPTTCRLRESANVAVVICCVHVVTLLLLLGLGFLYVTANGLGELPANLAQPFPDIKTVRFVGVLFSSALFDG